MLSQFMQKRKERKRLTQSAKKESPKNPLDLSFGSVHLSQSPSPLLAKPYSLNFVVSQELFPTDKRPLESETPAVSQELLPPPTMTERKPAEPSEPAASQEILPPPTSMTDNNPMEPSEPAVSQELYL